MDEAPIEAKGSRRCSRRSLASPRSPNAPPLARALGATLRADVDVLNNTNLHTDNLFGLWVAQDLERADPLRAVPAAGRPRHARPRLLPRPVAAHGRHPHEVPGAHRGGARARAACRTRAAEAARIFDARAAHRRRRTRAARTPRTCTRATTTGSAPTSRNARARARLGRLLRRRRARPAARVRRLAAERASPGIAALVGERAARRPGRTTCASTLHRARRRRTCRRPSSTRTSPSTAQCSRAPPQQRAALEARRRRDQRARSARRSASSTCERYFPPCEKARAEAMVKNLLAAFAERIDKLEWMAPATKARRPRPSSPRSRSGVGYPDKWRDYPALEVVRGDAFGNAAARRAVRAPAQP